MSFAVKAGARSNVTSSKAPAQAARSEGILEAESDAVCLSSMREVGGFQDTMTMARPAAAPFSSASAASTVQDAAFQARVLFPDDPRMQALEVKMQLNTATEPEKAEYEAGLSAIRARAAFPDDPHMQALYMKVVELNAATESERAEYEARMRAGSEELLQAAGPSGS